MSTQTKTLLTPEQYLEIERKAPYKSEYLNGEVFAMSGASRAHNLISTNVTSALRPQLRGRGCEIYAGDMRVHISGPGIYTYPDIVVACSEPKFLDGRLDTLLNPTFLAEVLSPSTEAYDLGRKFEYYRKLESLRQYLVIAQDRPNAGLYTKQDERWFLVGADRMDDTLDLRSIGCRVTLTEIYEDVALPPPQLSGELS